MIRIPSPKFQRTSFKDGELCSNIDSSVLLVDVLNNALCYAVYQLFELLTLNFVFSDVIQKCDAHWDAFLAFCWVVICVTHSISGNRQLLGLHY